MKLLLCKNVAKLGIVGDVVDVAPGYGRNYLVPYGLATEPNERNERRLAEARKIAERERAEELDRLAALATALEGVEVTLRAKANEDGVLYGSLGKKEIAAALEEEGHFVSEEHIVLAAPIRHLDNLTVDLRLGDEIRSTVKVWVVREKVEGESDEDATADDDVAGDAGEAIGEAVAESGMESGAGVATDGDGTED